MNLVQQFELPYPPATVWDALQDLEEVARCMPGAALDAPPVNGNLRGHVTIKLGAITASFAGEGAVRSDPATRTGTIEGGGVDKRSTSRVKGTAVYTVVAAADDASLVKVTVDYQLSGMLAQFSRGGIIQSVSTQITAAFSENLRKLIASQLSAEGAEAAIHRATMRPTAPSDNALSLGSLLWASLKAFFTRLLHRTSAL